MKGKPLGITTGGSPSTLAQSFTSLKAYWALGKTEVSPALPVALNTPERKKSFHSTSAPARAAISSTRVEARYE